VTNSLDFWKYAIEDPLWLVAWVIRLQIFLNISWALPPSSPPLSTAKGIDKQDSKQWYKYDVIINRVFNKKNDKLYFYIFVQ
jgi:hypothetical protein